MDDQTKTRTINTWVVEVVGISRDGLPDTKVFGSLAEAQGYAAGLAKVAVYTIKPVPVDA